MRIIAGTNRGRNLISPIGLGTRPTADRVREAVFSSIGSRVFTARILDLFAGTGAMSLEALSRGALSAVLIEKDKSAAEIIKKNIALCKAQDARLIVADCFSVIPSLKGQFDLVFIDPPYNRGLLSKALIALLNTDCLSEDALIVAETSSSEPEEICFEHLFEIKRAKYGEAQIIYYCIK